MVFEIGKCYKHPSAGKMRIVGEVDTYIYGNCLVGETWNGELRPVGRDEDNAVNWVECEDFANEEKEREDKC